MRAVALADGRAESWLETCGRLTFAALGLPPFVPQVELWADDRLLKVADGWYPDAAVAIEFDGRVKYRRPRYGATPEDVLWKEKRSEDLLRSLGVRFVRAAPTTCRRPGAWSSTARAPSAVSEVRERGVPGGPTGGGTVARRRHR